PSQGFGKARRHHDAVADAFDVRRATRQAHQFAGARGGQLARIELLPFDVDRLDRGDAADDFDLIAVRLGEPHALAAAGFVDGLDAGGAGRLGDALEIVFVVDV